MSHVSLRETSNFLSHQKLIVVQAVRRVLQLLRPIFQLDQTCATPSDRSGPPAAGRPRHSACQSGLGENLDFRLFQPVLLLPGCACQPCLCKPPPWQKLVLLFTAQNKLSGNSSPAVRNDWTQALRTPATRRIKPRDEN